MKIFNLKLRHKIHFLDFGFTEHEARVISFLLITFFIGLGVWGYRHCFAPLPAITEPVEVVLEQAHDTDDLNEAEPNNVIQQLQININQATTSEFELLPGIGQVKAMRIVEYRKRHQKFKSLDELKNIPGIGKKTLETLKPFIYL